MNKATKPLTLSVLEFCQHANIGKSTFWRAVREGWGPRLVRVGRRVLVRMDEAERWLKEREVNVSGKGA